MNKNWLYRVLALALVAMLALPMFAMAEDVLPEQVEEAAEAGEVTFGEDEAVAKDSISDYYDLADVDRGIILVNLAYDDPDREVSSIVVGVDNNLNEVKRDLTPGMRAQIIVTGSAPTSKIKFKTSNKKVAQINSEGVLTCVDVGTAKITVTGRSTYGNKKLKMTFKVKVKDDLRAEGVVMAYDDVDATHDGSWDAARARQTTATKVSYDDMDIVKSGQTLKVVPGYGWNNNGTLPDAAKYFSFMAFNKDGIYLDGVDKDTYDSATDDVGPFTYDRGYQWKITKGSSVMWADNTANKTFGSFGNAPLHFVFYKPGKASLTVTTANRTGNSTSKSTFNFEVVKNKVTIYKPTKADLALAKDRDTLYYGIQDIEVKSMGEVVVTLFFVNGTGFSVDKLKDFTFSLKTGMLDELKDTKYPNYRQITVNGAKVDLTAANMDAAASTFVQIKEADKRTIKTSIKSGKISTVKLTFKSTYKDGSLPMKYIKKSGEIVQPWQDLNSDRWYYIIDDLSFSLAGGFYRKATFNPTMNFVEDADKIIVGKSANLAG
jgi:hypothetical protein